MKHWLAVPALVLGLCLALTGLSAQAIAKGGGKKQAKTKVFEACKHGCKFNTIQKAVNAAGAFKFKKANAKVKVTVAVKPGKYVEGVVDRRNRAEEELRRPDDRRHEEEAARRRSSKARTPRANWARPRTASRRSASTAWC